MQHDELVLPADGSFLLKRVRVPRCLLTGALPELAVDRFGDCLIDLDIENGRIATISTATAGTSSPNAFDLEGRMVWPTLADLHTHLDKGEVLPRVEPDGTIDGAAVENGRDESNWSDEDLFRRMRFGLRCAYVQGVSAIRTHLDYRGPRAQRSWDVFRTLQEEWKGKIALQAVGLASLELFTTPEGERFADLIAERGGIMGGVTDALGAAVWAGPGSIDRLIENFLNVAERRGLSVDLHTDQTADLTRYTLPNIARAVLHTEFSGRVVVDHCVNLALQPEEIARETIALCTQAGLAFVTLPTSMLYLMDRAAGRTPRWRGVTLAHELRAAGIPIALATDNCRDSWFPYGDHDMVDIYRQSVRIFQFDHPVAEAAAMVGPVPAAIMGLSGIGSIAVGHDARLILFRARNVNEILTRPQSDRIVLDRGRRILDPLPDYTELGEV